QYTNATNKEAQYRLQVTFDNGRQYYSNSVALQGVNASATPKLFTTFIHTGSLQVASPGTYAYAIVDAAGQVVKKGQVAEGTTRIQVDFLKRGLYFISFEKGTQRVVEKFVRP
ncbi:MAG TPA: T9SS type A sorting domain-containing protein, partial [Chitinophagaceae bacterium]|nr:T9SS type A sorting domain-containing protein [Chitinophagaceae bacterium]